MSKHKKDESKEKGSAKPLSPWRCVWCTEPIDTPEELGRNPQNLPVHQKCLKKLEHAQAEGKFTPRTESISENGTSDAPE